MTDEQQAGRRDDPSDVALDSESRWDRDRSWVDSQDPRLSDEARAIIRRVRRRRRRARIGRLPSSIVAHRTVSYVRLGAVVATLLALVLGYVGLDSYLPTSHHPGAALDVMYYDLQLFVLGANPLLDGGPFPWPLQIARFLAPAVTLFAVLEVVRLVFAQELRRARTRQRRGHVVICGESPLADALVARETAAGNEVVVIQPDGLAYPGASLVDGDARDPRVLVRAAAARARRLYAADRDAAVNLAIVLGAAGRNSGRRAAPDLYGSIPDPTLLAALAARRLAAPATGGVRFFNAEELAASQLAAAEIDLLAQQPEGVRVLVAGMTDFGRALIVELSRRWRNSRPTDRLRVTIVDPAATATLNELLDRFTFLPHVCEFDPQDSQQDLAGWAADAPVATEVIRTYICHTDQQRALRDAFLATALWRGPESVLVRLDSYALFGIDFHGGAAGFDDASAAVRPFGVLDAATDVGLVGEDVVDKVAEELHLRQISEYLREGRPEEPAAWMRPWSQLLEELKESNRRQVRGIAQALSAVGCLVVPADPGATPFHPSPDIIERMAELEHDRWRHDMATRGWAFGHLRDEQRKLHPALVPWAALPEPFRERSRAVLLDVPAIFTSVGLRIMVAGNTTSD